MKKSSLPHFSESMSFLTSSAAPRLQRILTVWSFSLQTVPLFGCDTWLIIWRQQKLRKHEQWQKEHSKQYHSGEGIFLSILCKRIPSTPTCIGVPLSLYVSGYLRIWFNSFWPSDTICGQHGSVLAQSDNDSDSDSDKVYSTKIYTSTISGLHEFLRNTNNTIVLIYK